MGILAIGSVAVAPARAACVSAGATWVDTSTTDSAGYSGQFTAEFDATPDSSGLDGLVGISDGAGATFQDFAAMVRFSVDNKIDVRNGNSYKADLLLGYVAGMKYHFRLTVDVTAHTYSVYLTVPGWREVRIAKDYAFRGNQQKVTVLNNYGVFSSYGNLQVCNFVSSLPGNKPPVAVAKATPTSGDAPLTVNLDGSGSSDPDGTIAAYSWDFGDNTTGSGAKVTHVYSTAGNYTAVLTVTDDGGAKGTANVAIAVAANTCKTGDATWQNSTIDSFSDLFEADFDATPQAAGVDGVIGLSQGAATDYSGLAAAVRFNTNNTIDVRNGGVYAADATVPYTPGTKYHVRLAIDVAAHSYDVFVQPAGGTEQKIAAGYAFRTEQQGVTAINNWGICSSLGATQVCDFTAAATTRNKPPVATMTVTPQDGEAPLAVSCDASGSSDPDGKFVSYAWNWGDSATSGTASASANTAQAAHTYSEPGNYTVTLTVTDDAGASSSATTQVTVKAAAGACVTSTAAWQNSTMGPYNDLFQVDFDATALTAGSDCVVGLSQGTGTSYSSFAAIARLNTSNTIDARNADAYTAQTSVSYAANTQYHFRMVIDVPAHTYDLFVQPAGGAEQQLAAGYAFRTEQQAVTALDNWGVSTDIGSAQVCNFTTKALVRNKPPVAALTVTPSTGEAPLKVACDGTGSSDPDGKVTAYQWDFGDGSAAVQASQTTHTYSVAGDYTVTLKVTDDAGATATATKTVSVKPAPGSCVTSTAAWQNYSMTAQTGAFTVEFDATPAAANMDGGVVLSATAMTDYPDAAVAVRFNSAGQIDARNGNSYSSDAVITYTAGTMYHFRLTVGIPSHSYSVYVTPAGGSEQLLGSAYSFRTEQMAATSIANWGTWSSVSTLDVCNFVVGPPPPATLAVSTTTLDFGTSGTSQTFDVWNAGGSTINYSIADNANWLTVTPTSGTSNGQRNTITAKVDRSGLATGTYTGKITVTPSTGAVITILVTMQYATVPQIKLKPIARWDTVPYERINAGSTLKIGVVAFSKFGIAKVRFTVNSSSYKGTNPIDVTQMTLNDQSGVWEYWCPLNASDFTTDGPFSVDAAVYGMDGGYRDRFTTPGLGLGRLSLVVNATGKLPQVQAWVSTSGSDSSGVVNDSSRPYATVGRAIDAIRAYRSANGFGNNADGGIVRLMPGSHTCSTGGVAGPIACDNEYVTITTAAGGTRDNTTLLPGNIVPTRKICVRGITLNGSGVLAMSGTDRLQTQMWVDNCTLIGAGMGLGWAHPLAVEWQNLYYTDSSITQVAQATSGSTLCRGLTIAHISDDAFQNIPMVVNCTVDDINPLSTGVHADCWQHGGGAGDDNVIVYGLRATNLMYQSIFIRGDVSSPPSKAQGMAFVNVYTAMSPNSNGWGGWYRWVDHLLWWNCTYAVKGIGIMNDTYAGVRQPCSISNFSCKGCDFAFLGRGDDSLVDYSEWDQNHFVDPSVTLGQHVTTGYDGLDSNGVPTAGSPLLDRFSPVVPVDAANKVRSGLSDVGAYER